MSSVSAFPVTIYHNPGCSNSRQALAVLHERGIEPEVIDYVKNPPNRERLQALLQAMNLPARDLLRPKEAVYGELGLMAPNLSDDVLIDAMLTHPVLMNRPIVVTPLGVRLCRPGETVREILPP